MVDIFSITCFCDRHQVLNTFKEFRSEKNIWQMFSEFKHWSINCVVTTVFSNSFFVDAPLRTRLMTIHYFGVRDARTFTFLYVSYSESPIFFIAFVWIWYVYCLWWATKCHLIQTTMNWAHCQVSTKLKKKIHYKTKLLWCKSSVIACFQCDFTCAYSIDDIVSRHSIMFYFVSNKSNRMPINTLSHATN